MKLFKKSLVVLMLLLIGAFVFAGGQSDNKNAGGNASSNGDTIKKATYSWTAGGMGGGWYTTAGGMAALVNRVEPNITIKVVPGGGMENPLKLAAKQFEFGWGVSFIDKAAYNGSAPLFKKAYKNIYGLAGNFSVDYHHYLAADSTGVTTFDEFIEKIKNGEKLKIAIPMAGTSGNTILGLVLKYYGLSFDDIKKAGGTVTNAVYGDMINLYKDRHVNYVFAALGIPAAAITEMTISRPSTLMAMSDEIITHMADEVGTVSLDSGVSFVPGGTYKGMDKDIQQIGHSTEICASEDLPDDVAYAFVKALMENIGEVQNLSASYKKYFSKENAPKTTIPLHPGAAKYYREAGLLK